MKPFFYFYLAVTVLLFPGSGICLDVNSTHPLPEHRAYSNTNYLCHGFLLNGDTTYYNCGTKGASRADNGYVSDLIHTGIDYDNDQTNYANHDIRGISEANKVIATFPGIVESVTSDVTCIGLTCRNFGNNTAIKHVLSNGSNIYSLYGHFIHIDGHVQGGGISSEGNSRSSSFVTGKSRIGFKGTSGSSTGDHLHFEISNQDSAASPSQCRFVDGQWRNNYWLPENDCLNGVRTEYATGSSRTYDPSPFSNGNKEILVPYMHNDENQDHTDYDVYGVTESDIFASIQIDNDSNEQRNFTHLSVHGNSYHTQTSVHNFPDFETQTVAANRQQIFQSSLTLDPGDYSFKAHSDQFQDAFPIKFTVLQDDGSVIVDNDQLNDNGYSFVESIASAEVDYTPGYYLSAKLVNGRSNASAEWHPNVSGNYDIYIHIPGEKRAVRSVSEVNGQNVVTRYEYPNEIRYRIVYNDNRDSQIVTLAVNGVRDNWAQLRNPDAAIDYFDFSDSSYVELYLSGNVGDTHNYNYNGIAGNHLVPFDAIKFEHIASTNDAEVKLSIWYDKNARKPTAGDEIKIECYFNPSGEADNTIEVDGQRINSEGTESATDPFILSATYELPKKNEVVIGCVAGSKKVTGKISNINKSSNDNKYNEPKFEEDIKEGDRIAVQSNSIDVYTCSPSEKGFYTATLIGQAPIGLQGNIEEAFFAENGNMYRKIEWIEWDKIAIGDNESLCIAGENVRSLDNPCFFDDFSGKRVEVKENDLGYVNCRPGENGEIDWDNNKKTTVDSGTLGFSKNNERFYDDGYWWTNVNWYKSNIGTCYSAEEYLNIVKFDDTPYYEAVGEMCKLGVVSGYGSLNNKFGPSNFLTRAEVSKIIVNTIKKISSGTPVFNETDDKYAENAVDTFDDVSSGYNLAKYIGKLSTAGVVRGYHNGKFGPNDNVSRGQLTKFIVNALLIDSSKKDWPDSCKEKTTVSWNNCIDEFDIKYPKDQLPCPFDNADSYDFCRYLYKLEGTAMPIYTVNTFVDISSKDQSEKFATRGETMKAVYSSFIKRTQMSCNLLDSGKSYAESCIQN